ncbi:MAG: outer membrane beta-barrel protein [Winogradskyella sp.]|uniref:hypothetical protein n=1 Tax=Winogradskyella sp. TaxID=1883156 RepID=UPI001836F3A6|nr:hypothetical protein [Winogradskyella sp.]MBT8246037.1 outer membrane beta-barrel protein [Winogradskyella sp.]NNK22246.1 outer membrane beta-barrel protein [Winogradskyella sp.]
MSDKKHIDGLFQEKFQDFDVSPDPKLWDNIETRLVKKKKRRVIAIWWQLGGVAAAIVLLFAVGNSLFTDSNNIDEIPIIVNADEKDEQNDINSKDNDSFLKKNEVNVASEDSLNDNTNDDTSNNLNDKSKKLEYSTNQSKSAIASQNSKTKNNNTSNFLSSKNTQSTEVITSVSNESNSVKENTYKNSDDKTKLKSDSEIKALLKTNTTKKAIALSEKNENLEVIENEKGKGQDIEKAIAEANTINEKEEEKLRRWSIAPNVAPVVFNSFGEGSSIDNQFNNNNKTSDITLSVGIKGSYAINNRLKVTAGINRVNFNNTTNDIIALSDNSFASRSNGNNLENVKLNANVNNASLTVMSRTSINNASIPGAINTIQTGDLNQNFGFIEIPLEVEYRVLDKKIGLNLSGGFSTLLLNENEIFADVNGESTSIGEANNINNTSFSANIGIGLDYGLTEKININLEPKFKYQLNTFNNTSGDFRPFFIGVYTGLSFRF